MAFWPLILVVGVGAAAFVRSRSRKIRSIVQDVEDNSWEDELRNLPAVGDEDGESEEPDYSIDEGEPDQCFLLGGDGDEATEIPCADDDPTLAPIWRGAGLVTSPVAGMWPIARGSKNPRRFAVSYWTEQGVRGASGRSFGAKRATLDRDHWHTGIDFYADAGDVVIAPEAGTVIAVLPFTGPTWAVYVRSIDGQRVFVLGEVADKSWRDFHIKPGRSVGKGDPLALVANQGDATMLHFEIYEFPPDLPTPDIVQGIRDREFQWNDQPNPPPELRDPSGWAVATASAVHKSEIGGLGSSSEPWKSKPGWRREREYLRLLGYRIPINDQAMESWTDQMWVGLFQKDWNRIQGWGMVGPSPLTVDGDYGTKTSTATRTALLLQNDEKRLFWNIARDI